MTIDAITTLISGVGFPIACCIVLFYQNSQLQKTLADISATMQALTSEVQDIERRLEKEV